MKNTNSRLVYSTDQGRVNEKKPNAPIPEGDGIIRLRRETKGRNGKGVTCIQGFELDEKDLKLLAKKLKKVCGTGGTAKAGTIEIQGDQREKLKTALESMGYQVKLAGG